MAFVVAHRAGNDLRLLRSTETAGVAMIEADLRLWHRRLEVRHLRRSGRCSSVAGIAASSWVALMLDGMALVLGTLRPAAVRAAVSRD